MLFLSNSQAVPPLSIEGLSWVRQDDPAFPPAADEMAWDHENVYSPVIARNPDGSVWRDGSNNLHMYYNGDNNVGTDYDQVGLARGVDFDNLSRYGSSPVIALGADPSLDAGDAQITGSIYTGGQFVNFYQGNATPPGDLSGDNVTGLYATSADGLSFTKQGQFLGKGSVGDVQDLYAFRPVFGGHHPRIFYVGKNSGGTLGLMSAVSNSWTGVWQRVSDDHLFQNGITWVTDAWWERGQYNVLYFPGGSSPGGMHLVTSLDGVNFTDQGQVLDRRAGEWDASTTHGQFVNIGGVNMMIYNGSSGNGIGYAYEG